MLAVGHVDTTIFPHNSGPAISRRLQSLLVAEQPPFLIPHLDDLSVLWTWVTRLSG